jgi:dTDP-4-dehydrorhamnose 3,5-epimerase-like enzyme
MEKETLIKYQLGRATQKKVVCCVKGKIKDNKRDIFSKHIVYQLVFHHYDQNT